VLSAIALGPLLFMLRLPQRSVESPEAVCVVSIGDVLVGTQCADADPWFGTARERAALGTAICWWHSGAGHFAELNGVGGSVAVRLVGFREEGGTPSIEELMEIRGIGESLASRIVEGVTTRCARVVPADSR